ncbi:hypothetical protein [Acinetobacter sp. GSS19]|uniref:hypothetical protein n=1 Tax=Acinetobacter sp. GSS19 TaxID=3020716 RepID=UPI00235ED8D1|nr:hypothetical protein [Acinetobacter sp. GSS19]
MTADKYLVSHPHHGDKETRFHGSSNKTLHKNWLLLYCTFTDSTGGLRAKCFLTPDPLNAAYNRINEYKALALANPDKYFVYPAEWLE